jgi:segregation and condensation protein A
MRAQVYIEQSLQPRFPDVQLADLQEAWRDIVKRARWCSTTRSAAKS